MPFIQRNIFTSCNRPASECHCEAPATPTCFTGVNSAATKTACTQLGQIVGSSGQIAQCFAGPINISTAGQRSGGSHAAMAFWAGTGTSPQQNYLYMIGANDHMKAFQMQSNGQFNVNYPAAESVPKDYNWPGATPAVSWDGSTPRNAVVWAVDTSQYGLYNPAGGGSVQAAGNAVLYGYAAVPTGNNCSTSACRTRAQHGFQRVGLRGGGPPSR